TVRRGAAAGRLAAGPTEGVGAGAVAQQQGHDRPHRAGDRPWGPRAPGDLAELPDRLGALPELLCRARGSSSGTAGHGGAAAGAPASASDRRGGLAMDEVRSGVRWAVPDKTVAQKARVKPGATIAVINRGPGIVEPAGLLQAA